MRVLLVGAELTPLAKVGGLGDYLGALPKALLHRVTSVGVALPYHATIHKQKTAARLQMRFTLQFGGREEVVSVWKAVVPDTTIPLYLFDNPHYLSRGDIYHSAKVWDPIRRSYASGHYSDLLRFLFFSEAVYRWLQHRPIPLDIVHASDWHMAPLVALLKTNRKTAHLRTLLTMHNVDVGSRGVAKPMSVRGRYVDLLPPELSAHVDWRMASDERSVRVFTLGLQRADLLNTVSPAYAKELLTPAAGHGLETILRHRRAHFSAVLNGLDTIVFNPATDSNLHTNYTWASHRRKLENKLWLQHHLGWAPDANKPLLGMVARVVEQKGFDLVLKLLPALAKLNVQLVITGTGDPYYERRLRKAARRYHRWFHYNASYDDALGQQIYGGSDMFLMPSQYEPCGLSQLIAMRYGAVPIVHATGGLKNTVFHHQNGFTFQPFTLESFTEAVAEAIDWYRNNPKRWQKLMRTAMTSDYSWNVSAKAYVQLYRKLMRQRRTHY